MSRNYCSPKEVFAAPKNRERVRFQSGNTADIITTILEADRSADSTVIDAECLRGRNDYETARNVWAYVKGNVRYRADRPGHERIKSPAALFDSKVGDCKSFSIAEAALLRALGFKNVYYRFAAYTPGDFTHVYVVLKPRGREEIILDAVHTRFDDEVAYRNARDYRASGGGARGVAGLPGSQVNGTFSTAITLATLAGAGLLLYYLLSDND